MNCLDFLNLYSFGVGRSNYISHRNNPYQATDELLELIANLPGK